MFIVYDIELYQNLFLIVFYNTLNKTFHVFELSPRKDNRHLLIQYLNKIKSENLVGFNNVLFDYPILNHFMRLYRTTSSTRSLVEALFNKAQLLLSIENKWSEAIKKPAIKQTDLYLINHYNNFSKSTSLKILEFNLRMTNIQVLPYDPFTLLSNDQIDKVIDYCKNDVIATTKFLNADANQEAINFRNRMSKEYKIDFTNYNDVKIGEEILLSEVSKELGKGRYEVSKLRTYRKTMKLSDIILPYVKFNSLEFNTLLNWWKKQEIKSTKSQFNEIPLENVSELLPYCNTELKKGKLANLNLIYKGFQFDFGTGGLHGTLKPGVFRSNRKYEIIHVDVSSYYPNLAFQNGFHPAHLPQHTFVTTGKKMYRRRMNAKKTGDNQAVKGIKLALNGALYGKSNSPFSFMFDSMFTMNICINGQLLLSMPTEQFLDNGFEVIQVNTDGIIIRVKRKYRYIVDRICKEWMELTGLKLDYDFYDLIAQRDVNNYIGRKVDGSIKYKGLFDYHYTKNGEFHKNYSMLIVPKALEAYFINRIPPDQFIENHTDMYDFFKRTKFDRNTRLIRKWANGQEDELPRITRYFVSTDGQTFLKIMKPLAGKTEDRVSHVEAEYLCTEVNDLDKMNMREMQKSIDYRYYIEKVEEAIDIIEGRNPIESAGFILTD